MSRIGSRKEIKLGGTTGVQMCIDGYLVHEVLPMIPKSVNIVGANVMISIPGKSHKIVVPNALRRLGVTYMREKFASKEASLVFDEVKPYLIEKNVKKICTAINADYKSAYFESLALSSQDASVRFHKMTKEIHPDETDLRKKAKVLGAKTGIGKVSNVYAALSASEYVCDFETIQVRIATCKKRGTYVPHKV